jgi:formylglycine-generating enzyme required for sulfatase activity
MLPETSAGLAEEVRCNDTILLYTSRPDSHDERPMNCLSWPLAFAFCAWDDARLPTEAEWAFAAAGGAEQRPYPWGNAAPDAERASFGCNARGGSDCVLEDVLSVGQLPKGAGRWRHLDLAGNAGEWVLDSATEYPLPCDDCAALGATFGDRTYRGGTFDDLAANLANGVRGDGPATARGRDIGVRCARDVAD